MKGKQKILLLVCSVIAVVSVSGMAAYRFVKDGQQKLRPMYLRRINP